MAPALSGARRALRPCLGCSRLIRSGSRCQQCDPRGARSSAAWTQTSRAVRAAHVSAYGLVCPGLEYLGHEEHAVASLSDLTVDHIVPLADGGELLKPENLRVVCREWNSRRRGT